MGIERRGNREYYYKKKKIGGCVVSKYVGGSDFDLMLYKWHKIDGYKEKHARNLIKAERCELEEIDRKLDEIEAKLNILTAAFLVNQGFYQSSSREWRFKYDKKD